MKAVPVPLRFLCTGVCATLLPAQGPVLSTPGTATWETIGGVTTFTILDDTVLDWDSLYLPKGDQFIFDFLGGNSVINQLGGTGVHTIDGNIQGNGHLGFFSPNATLNISGNITADSVTLSTLNVDPAEFRSGNGFRMFGGGSTNQLLLRGNIEATKGDVVIAGRNVAVRDTSRIRALDSVLIGGGTDVTVNPSGDRRLTRVGNEGIVLHLGDTGASRIEISAGQSVVNVGKLGNDDSHVFLEVGNDGRILNEGSGFIVPQAVFRGVYDPDGVVIVPQIDGELMSLVNDASLKLPALKRPDGTQVSTTKKRMNYSAPMSASADGMRDRAEAKPNRNVVKRDNSKSLMSRSSFFGMRGGRKSESEKR